MDMFYVLLALACVSARDIDSLINEINSKQELWRAGRNFRTPLLDLEKTLSEEKMPKKFLETFPVLKHNINVTFIPTSFDARDKWPKCKTIKEVRDQSGCGSSWAIAASSVISDRICIHSNGKLQPEISARYLVACDKEMSSGCQKGFPGFALQYWKDKGVVTGGSYQSNIGCQPYPFAPCIHYGTGTKPPCPQKKYDTPQCVQTCDNTSMVFKKEIFFGKSVYQLKTESQIQFEIMFNGPVTATMFVYDDFPVYKSGVYYQFSRDAIGTLAVKIIGWGVEKKIPYWLAVNSWNEEWGDNGMFKIRRGYDECGIEDEVFGGIPK